jgi:hypothetical protein
MSTLQSFSPPTTCKVYSGSDKEIRIFRSEYEDLSDSQFYNGTFFIFENQEYCLEHFVPLDYKRSHTDYVLWANKWELKMNAYTGNYTDVKMILFRRGYRSSECEVSIVTWCATS